MLTAAQVFHIKVPPEKTGHRLSLKNIVVNIRSNFWKKYKNVFLAIANKICLFLLPPFIAFSLLYPIASFGSDNASRIVKENIFAAAVVSDNTYVLVGDRGHIFLSADHAETWQPIHLKPYEKSTLTAAGYFSAISPKIMSFFTNCLMFAIPRWRIKVV